MDFFKKNFQAIKDIWWTVSALWIIVSAIPTTIYMCARGAAGQPPEIVLIRGLAIFCLFLFFITLVRYNLEFEMVDFSVIVDSRCPQIRWRFWIGKTFEDRQVLGSCAKCDKGIHQILTDKQCSKCRASLCSPQEYDELLNELKAEQKVVWMTTKEGYTKVASPNKV